MNTQFQLKSDGSVERVGPFGCYGPSVHAKTKTEAIAKFLSFAFRAVENSPRVKIRNGAYQLAYESLEHGINVESGVEERQFSLCCSGVSDWNFLNDETASFNYYASPQYRMESEAA